MFLLTLGQICFLANTVTSCTWSSSDILLFSISYCLLTDAYVLLLAENSVFFLTSVGIVSSSSSSSSSSCKTCIQFWIDVCSSVPLLTQAYFVTNWSRAYIRQVGHAHHVSLGYTVSVMRVCLRVCCDSVAPSINSVPVTQLANPLSLPIS